MNSILYIESFVVDLFGDHIWVGGYQIYSNTTYYWLDGEPVDLNGLAWFPGDPNDNVDACLILNVCDWWVIADFTPKAYLFRVLCEI